MDGSEACCNCGGPFPLRPSTGYIQRASLFAKLPKQAENSLEILQQLGIKLSPQMTGSSCYFLCPKCISFLTKVSIGWREFQSRATKTSQIFKCQRRNNVSQEERLESSGHPRRNLRNITTYRKQSRVSWVEVVRAFRKGRTDRAFRLIFQKASNLMRRSLLKVLREVVRREINSYVKKSEKNMEVFVNQSDFSWKKDQVSLRRKCPTTMSILKAVVTSPSSEKKGLTKKGTKLEPVIGTLTGIIMYSRCPYRLDTLQVANGLQLYISGCTKKVFTRFNQLGICVSHKKILSVIDNITQHFDSRVNEWRTTCENNSLNEHFTEAERATDGLTEMDCSGEASLTSESLNTYSNTCDLDDNKEDVKMSMSDTESQMSNHSDVQVNIPLNSQLTEVTHQTQYTICFDNVNIFTKVHNETTEKQNKLFNMIQTFATLDRINSQGLSEVQPGAEEVRGIPISAYLPTSFDEMKMIEEREYVISNILVKWLPCFKDLHCNLSPYITHRYMKESSSKSEMVPLGVVCKDEAKIGDVISYLREIQKYVPVTFQGTHQKVVLFGDGLSCERVSSAQDARLNCNTSSDRLECFQPVAGDWHKRVLLLQDAFDELYTDGSTISVGSLANLKCFLQRKNVRTAVKKSFGHSYAFLEFVTEAYVVVAAMHYLQIKNMEDTPKDQDQRRCKEEILAEVAHQIATVSTTEVSTLVEETVRNEARGNAVDEEEYPFCICREELGGTMVECSNKKCPRGKWFHLECLNITKKEIPEKSWFCASSCNSAAAMENSSAGKQDQDAQTDSIYEYSRSILWNGLNAVCRRDALRYNDGDRIVRHWKYDLLQFYRRKHYKYFMLANSLLIAMSGGCSKRLQHQIKWCRTVNPSGKEGCNLEMDLQMEHFNRIFKESMKSSGGNTSESTIQRHGRLVGIGQLLSSAYDRDFSQRFIAARAVSKPSLETDMKKTVQKIAEQDVFNFVPGRYHRGLINFRFRPFDINAKALHEKLAHAKEDIAQTRAINEVDIEVKV